ncbi:MAG: anti-sigma factor family protein [Vicinamibacteraceae bacterium]
MKTCSQFLALLSPLLDDELTPEAQSRVTRHRAECAECSGQLDAIRRGRNLARAVPDLDLPAGLSADILGRTTTRPTPQPWRRWVFAHPAVGLGVAVVLLVAAVGLWPDREAEDPPAPAVNRTAAAHPLHLVRLAHELGSGAEFDKIAATYQLRRIDLETALKQASFKVICPLHQDGNDAAHVRELRDCPLIHLRALRGDQEILLLQQPAGWPIVYGDHPVQHLTMAGQPCDRVSTDEREVFKWERGDTRWIVVARAGHSEVEKVVSTLLSTS